MKTWHIHISGRVQGVGFRPFVCRQAADLRLEGIVQNTRDGVHIRFNADPETARRFYHLLLQQAPPRAIIRAHQLEPAPAERFSGFGIEASGAGTLSGLMLTPDVAVCAQCRAELHTPGNSRYRYPFTTCIDCGPRYSIQENLPYDRAHTTMHALQPCAHCAAEYADLHDRRCHSQTNSCKQCAIPLHLYDAHAGQLSTDSETILGMLHTALADGATVAVKGIGGYLLLCDATAAAAVAALRRRKQRPRKPLALMYPGLALMEGDVLLTVREKQALRSPEAPVVLCRLKSQPASGLAVDLIAPGLDKVGLMLPSTPLLQLIAHDFGKPLVATSANLHGSPVVYRDSDALSTLGAFADLILCFDRDIVVPQDDSVMQFTDVYQQPVVLRRSRGMAPDYFPVPFTLRQPALAMGADLKSSFALATGDQLLVSQYLGDQASYESEEAYTHTLKHLLRILDVRPRQILTDQHPQYFVNRLAHELADTWSVPLQTVQHHEAHFAAVLAENGRLFSPEPVLGFIWDGNGYGHDGQIWGGECMLFEQGAFERLLHLDYFTQLQGDTMNREPRVSALALLRGQPEHLDLPFSRFNGVEQQHYRQLLSHTPALLTSSMGRLLDGIAAITGLCQVNSYEGEGALLLEAAARSCRSSSYYHYPMPLQQNRINWSMLTGGVAMDMKMGIDVPVIARKVWVSLAMLIKNLCRHTGVRTLAFSGGVFQNAFLVDLITERLEGKAGLLFHRKLSPNDECIGFGQLAVAALREQQPTALYAATDAVLMI